MESGYMTAISNILLIYPRSNEQKDFHFGFSYNWANIATKLHNAEHNVFMHDYSIEGFNEENFLSEVKNSKIDAAVIEFDTCSLRHSENYIHGHEIIRLLSAQVPQWKIIAYGDYCRITGENIPFASHTIKQDYINGVLLHFACEPACSFDELPFINRRLLQEQIPLYRHDTTMIYTSIGCENSCAFCHRHTFKQEYITHSDNYVFTEFEMLKSQQFRKVWIADDNFTFNLQRAKRILNGLIERKLTEGMSLSCSSWTHIDEEFLDLTKVANVKIISFGLETANPNILKFYRKNIDLHRTKELLQYADRIGIYTVGSFIIGAPMETYETIKRTFEFIRECKIDLVRIKNLVYMKGSQLYETLPKELQTETQLFACKENGLTNLTSDEIMKLKNDFLEEYKQERKEKAARKLQDY
jgi:radical SAM superfamily enzyme YgiQ (UPF0313 family)